MKTHSSDVLLSKHTFESLYIFPRLGILYPTCRMNRKENKLTENDVPHTKNDQSIPCFLLVSQ